MVLLNGFSGWESFIQLMGVLLIFVFVLGITYITTKWIARYQQGVMCNKNIRVIETFRVNNSKFIQIIQVGTKYLVISVCKDTINTLAELTEEELLWFPPAEDAGKLENQNFHEILEKLKGKIPRK